MSFRLAGVTRVAPRVTGAINSRETGERKLLDGTTRRARSPLVSPGREERGRSACIAEGRRTSRLRGFARTESVGDRCGYAMADSRFPSRTFQSLISAQERRDGRRGRRQLLSSRFTLIIPNL